MHRDEYLARLEALYAGYLKTVQELEDNRKLGEGMFGFKGGPADNPCHDRFAEDLRAMLADFAAAGPDSADVRALLESIYAAPRRFPRPRTAMWMLLAVHGLTAILIPLLEKEDAAALRKSYAAAYKRWERLPVQQQILRALEQAASNGR